MTMNRHDREAKAKRTEKPEGQGYEILDKKIVGESETITLHFLLRKPYSSLLQSSQACNSCRLKELRGSREEQRFTFPHLYFLNKAA